MSFEDDFRRGFDKLMKGAKHMQSEVERTRDEVLGEEVQGQAGGGLVKVWMNGRHRVIRVDIDPSLLDEDRDMLNDLIAAATNDAVEKAEQMVKAKLGGLAKGVGFPQGFKPPF